MSETKKCPRCSSVLWPNAFEDGFYLCPRCDEEYADRRTGSLELLTSLSWEIKPYENLPSTQ